MKVIKTEIPASSLLHAYFPADYSDAFKLYAKGKALQPDDILVSLWTDMPGWVNALFALRNALVRLVGLEGSKGWLKELETCIRTGTAYLFVEIPVKDERETVMLMKDKHLDAYFSIRVEEDGSIYSNTLVKYNNRLGKVYFFIIRPFHGIVVRSSFKRTVKNRGHAPESRIQISRCSMKKEPKTNAARLLDRAGIPYELILYTVDEHDLSAVHVAEQLGADVRTIFKTLVLRGDKTGVFVCVIPGDGEVDLKKAAKVSGNKKAELIPMKELLPLTGYIRGGCSPVGMKKSYPTYIDVSCEEHPLICISAGMRGMQIKLSPSDLTAFTQATIADLC